MDNCVKRMKQVFKKRRLVPVNSKKWALCSKIYYLFNQIPWANGCLITKNGDKLVRSVNFIEVKKYFVKMKSSKNRKPGKAS